MADYIDREKSVSYTHLLPWIYIHCNDDTVRHTQYIHDLIQAKPHRLTQRQESE